jgi:hypothetical protein
LALPAKESAQEPWQFAMKMLIDAADRGGIVMLARIAMLRALNRRQGGSGDRFAAQANEGLQDRQMNRVGRRTIFALLLIDTATRIWGRSATLTS